MRPRYWSSFWIGYLAGLVCLSPAWEGRDPQPRTQTHQAEGLSMAEWLRLEDSHRAAIVTEYAGSTPRISKEKRQSAAIGAD